jgi:hypothetical protein
MISDPFSAEIIILTFNFAWDGLGFILPGLAEVGNLIHK